MNDKFALLGRLSGLIGILLCVIAVVTRFSGHASIAGVSPESLLAGGTSGVVIGCFLLLLARSGQA